MIVDVDGVAAHATTGGIVPNPADPAILMVHGAGCDATIWQQQTRYLAHRGMQAIAVDLPGHGKSAGEPLATVVDQADWLVRFMDSCGVEEATLVGHSMGAFIVLEAAARLGNRCRSLVLMGAALTMPVHPQLLADADNDVAAAAALMVAWGHAKPAHTGLNPTPGMWMTGGARALIERSQPGVLATDLQAGLSYDDGPETAAAVKAATTVLLGLDDRMTPARSGRELAALLPYVNVIELPRVGHFMMTEAPRQVRAAILESAI